MDTRRSWVRCRRITPLHRARLSILPLLLFSALATPGAGAQPVGQILSARPADITIVRAGTALAPLEVAGLELRAWDRILVHGSAPVDLLLGQTRLQLTDGTEILLARPAPEAPVEIHLLIGRAVIDHGGSPRITGTPEALFRVSAARSLLLRSQAESRIVVQAGTVDLLRPGIRSLTAGEDARWPTSSGALALFADYRDADDALRAALESSSLWADLIERWTQADRQRQPVRLDQGMPVPPGLREDMDALRVAVRRIDALAPLADSLIASGDPSLRGPLRDARLIAADRAEAHYIVSLYQLAAAGAPGTN